MLCQALAPHCVGGDGGGGGAAAVGVFAKAVNASQDGAENYVMSSGWTVVALAGDGYSAGITNEQ